MSNFIRHKSTVQHIPSLLAGVVGFEQSTEYQALRDYELDIAGVVCGAFARYLSRIHSTIGQESNSVAIDSAHDVLERLATCSESAVRSLVTDEIFENLDGEPSELEEIRKHLKPKAGALFSRWLGPQQA
jgi:hypothetical protein